MSAVIIPLPGAAAVPVVQPQRKGRYPKMVAALWRFRFDRNQRQRRKAELLAEAQRLREGAYSMQETAHWALCEAAIAQAQAQALCVASTRVNQGLV